MWSTINMTFFTVLLSATDGDILLLPVLHCLLPNIQDGGKWPEVMIFY